jgi:hypothetical protein
LHVDLDVIRPDLVAEIVEARGAHALGLDDVEIPALPSTHGLEQADDGRIGLEQRGTAGIVREVAGRRPAVAEK